MSFAVEEAFVAEGLEVIETQLGISAFYGCTKLERFDMTNLVLYQIKYHAFYGCLSLTEVMLPYGFNTFISATSTSNPWVFANCTALVKLQVPSTIVGFHTSTGISKGEIHNNPHVDFVIY